MTRVSHRQHHNPSSDLQASLGPGPWLVIAPHDDDAIIGAGASIAAATAAGIAVHVCVVTDGRMGWDDPADQAELVRTRETELRDSLRELGVPAENLHLLGFADGSLYQERGCRPDDAGSGVGRALTRVMRAVRPGCVFVNTASDIHPDHRVVAEEVPMAVAWAVGAVWQEFGPPIPKPRILDYAVYCDFPTNLISGLRSTTPCSRGRSPPCAVMSANPSSNQ